jgi:hypothetical protein
MQFAEKTVMTNNIRNMHDGFAIVLAWPETLCKQAGAWYDTLLYFLGINRKGYYKVGHAALVLVNDETGICSYFDFGRYHAPTGHGRVRSVKTDHDLKIESLADISTDRKEILNLSVLLAELHGNPSTHGTGAIFASTTRINFSKAMNYACQMQEREIITYGPFIPGGTNCSRFVNSAILAGEPALSQRIKLLLPPMLTPTPMWNLRALGNGVISVGLSRLKTEIYPNKNIRLVIPDLE